MYGAKRGLFGSTPNSLADMARNHPMQPNALANWGQTANQTAPKPTYPDYGKRVDGTPKGRGYLGELKTADGRIMTEFSVGVDLGDGEEEIPSIVPSLTPEEIEYLRQGNDPTPQIVDKAVEHARQRKQMGLSPFAMRGLDY